MKKSRFTESQIVSAIKKHEGGITAKEVAREMGVSEAAFYQWKAKYGVISFWVYILQIMMSPTSSFRKEEKNDILNS